MAAVTVCSNFGAQGNKICHWFKCLPFYLPLSDGTKCHDLSCLFFFFFLMLNFKPALSLSSFTFINRLFSFSSLSAIKVVSSAYLRLIFLLESLIPACDSSRLAYHMIYSVYKLNKLNKTIYNFVLLPQFGTSQLVIRRKKIYCKFCQKLIEISVSIVMLVISICWKIKYLHKQEKTVSSRK